MSIKMLVFDYKDSEKEFFRKNRFDNFDIEFYTESLNEKTVFNISEDIRDDAVIISVFVSSHINEKVIEKFPNLQIVATRSTGYDHIDIESCRDRNIRVLNVEHYGKNAVSQYTFGLIILLLRKILKADYDMKNFRFNFNNYVGRELNELTLGVMGTGAIGSVICKLAHAFGMKILAYDVRHNLELMEKYGVQFVDLDTLLINSDVVTLHIPGSKQNYHIISKRELAIMKSSAYLINTARGSLVDTKALYDAIMNENIAGAALDVSECEFVGFSVDDMIYKVMHSTHECVAEAFLIRKLAYLPNVIITPHISYSTHDSIDRVLKISFNSIRDCFKGDSSSRVC